MTVKPIVRPRIAAVKRAIAKKSADAILITNPVNVSYLTGFKGHDAALLIGRSGSYFLTDSRYALDSQETVFGHEIVIVRKSILDEIARIIADERFRRIGFEAAHMKHAQFERLTERSSKTGFMPLYDIVEEIRACKDPSELDAIRESIRLAKRTLSKTVAAIGPRSTEQDLSSAIMIEFLRHGARAGFDPIVAAGKNSAKPHARPTRTVIKKQSFVMIDIGCELNQYNSDLTRTVILGTIHDTIKRIHAVVRDAHDRAIEAIKPGVRACEIDAAARSHIERAGYGAYFGHAVGHGVGREVHEKPSISKANSTKVRPGMVFTIEPAIYIPGLGGVRIEDMVLVTKKGCEVLTKP